MGLRIGEWMKKGASIGTRNHASRVAVECSITGARWLYFTEIQCFRQDSANSSVYKLHSNTIWNKNIEFTLIPCTQHILIIKNPTLILSCLNVRQRQANDNNKIGKVITKVDSFWKIATHYTENASYWSPTSYSSLKTLTLVDMLDSTSTFLTKVIWSKLSVDFQRYENDLRYSHD